MAALSANRNTPKYGSGGARYKLPHGSGVTLYRGALVVIDQTAGTVMPGTTSTTKTAAGRAETSTADDSAYVEFTRGTFLFDNSTSTDAITNAQYGQSVYIVDDHTVAKTSGSSTRSIAGICRGLDPVSGGVWVEI